MTLDFLLPIETVSHNIIQESVLKDLEVVESKSKNEETGAHSLFDVIYKPSHPVDELVKERVMSSYTTDISFLTQTSKFIKLARARQSKVDRDVLTRAYDAVKEITDEQDFHSKYQYIEIGLFKSLNHSPQFMQMLSFYNMLSPLITLLTRHHNDIALLLDSLPRCPTVYESIHRHHKAFASEPRDWETGGVVW